MSYLKFLQTVLEYYNKIKAVLPPEAWEKIADAINAILSANAPKLNLLASNAGVTYSSSDAEFESQVLLALNEASSVSGAALGLSDGDSSTVKAPLFDGHRLRAMYELFMAHPEFFTALMKYLPVILAAI